MNIADSYQAAIASEFNPVICLGLELKPYSGGHDVLLEAFGSPFINESLPSFDDLVIGVLICSQHYQEAARTLKSRWLTKLVKYWGWRARKLNPVTETLRFKSYVSEGRKFPDDVCYKVDMDGRELSSPSNQRMKILLMREIGMTEHEFLSRPLALSVSDWCTIQELDGVMGSMSVNDKAMFAEAKRRRNGA